jgi:hypothetical protein
MRAQCINELNFERGTNPRASMEIGGIDFTKRLEDALNKWKLEVAEKVLGKIITAEIRKIVKSSPNSNIRRTLDAEKMSIKVDEIQNIYDSQCTREGRPLFVLKFITDETLYSVDLDQKIWIE